MAWKLTVQTMAIPDKQDEQTLAEKHALELDALINDGIVASDKAYADAERKARENKEKRESALAALGVALGLLLQRNRAQANDIATLHAGAELKAIIGNKIERLTLPFGPTPKPAEVEKYINNAIDLARKSPTIDETAYRGRVIVVTETVGSYEKGKATVIDSIKSTPASVKQDAGFEVAKTQADIDASSPSPSNDTVPLVGEQWSAVLDRATCGVCGGLHGSTRALGDAWPYGYPPIHALCRCFIHIVTAGYAPAKRAIEPMPLPSKKNEPCTRVEMSVDERAVFDVESRTIKGAIASDETLDSHGSIIRADGWDLSRYAKNPVLIWAHKTGGWHAPEPEDVLGTASVSVEGKRLVADLHFSPTGMNPKADMVFQQMQAKIIRGLSVGFRPLEYHFERAAEDEDEIVVSDKQELVELSIVPVPSNSNTLAKEFRSFAQGCSGCECTNEAAELPRTEHTMTALMLPPAIATLLHVESVEDAVREISKKDLELDAAQKRVSEAEERAAAAEKALKDRDEKETVANVDALIAAGRISQDKRESALALARTSPQAFRDLYPPVSEAPKAHLLKRVVAPEDKTASEVAKDEDKNDAITKRANELREQGHSYLAAFSLAVREYEAKRTA